MNLSYFIPVVYKNEKSKYEYDKSSMSVATHALSDRTGSALVWHTRGRVVEPQLLQQLSLGAQGVLPMRVGDETSQLDLPSLTKLSVWSTAT